MEDVEAQVDGSALVEVENTLVGVENTLVEVGSR